MPDQDATAGLYSDQEGLAFMNCATFGGVTFRCLALFGGPSASNVATVQRHQEEYPDDKLLVTIDAYRSLDPPALDSISRAFTGCKNVALVAKSMHRSELLFGKKREVLSKQDVETRLRVFLKLLGKAVSPDAKPSFDDYDETEAEEEEEEEEEEEMPRPKRGPKSKLTPEMQEWAIKQVRSGMSRKEVAEQIEKTFGVAVTGNTVGEIAGMPPRYEELTAEMQEWAVKQVKSGMSRSEVARIMKTEYRVVRSARSVGRIPGMPDAGGTGPKSKLTDSEIERVKELAKQGLSRQKVATTLGEETGKLVNESTVRRCLQK